MKRHVASSYQRRAILWMRHVARSFSHFNFGHRASLKMGRVKPPRFWSCVLKDGLSRTRAGFSAASDSRSWQSMSASKTGMGKMLLLLSFRVCSVVASVSRVGLKRLQGFWFSLFRIRQLLFIHPSTYKTNFSTSFFHTSKQHSKQGCSLVDGDMR